MPYPASSGWHAALVRAGFQGTALISERGAADPFGNSEAVFRCGKLLLRIRSDRGDEFVDLASTEHPNVYFRYEDILAGLGWKRPEEILALPRPMPLKDILEDLNRRWNDLENTLNAQRWADTLARIQKFAAQRESDFKSKLKRLADQAGRTTDGSTS
jgi:hypothetical protein